MYYTLEYGEGLDLSIWAPPSVREQGKVEWDEYALEQEVIVLTEQLATAMYSVVEFHRKGLLLIGDEAREAVPQLDSFLGTPVLVLLGRNRVGVMADGRDVRCIDERHRRSDRWEYSFRVMRAGFVDKTVEEFVGEIKLIEARSGIELCNGFNPCEFLHLFGDVKSTDGGSEPEISFGEFMTQHYPHMVARVPYARRVRMLRTSSQQQRTEPVEEEKRRGRSLWTDDQEKHPKLGQKFLPEHIGFMQGAGKSRTAKQIRKDFHERFGITVSERTVRKYRNKKRDTKTK